MSALLRAARGMLPQAVCVATFAMPILVWSLSTGNVIQYFTSTVPPGQTLFILSKLFALLSIVMFWFQIMSALARHSPALAGFPRLTRTAHVYFGAATYAAVLTHVALFVAASSVRTQHLAADLLLPAFGHGFYRAMVSLGAIAFWTLCAALIAGWRRRYGDARLRWGHRLILVTFVLAFVHGLTIGSETRFGLMTYVYAFMGLSVGTAMLSWGWSAAREARRREVAREDVAAITAAERDGARAD